jgi:hypothetical protein
MPDEVTVADHGYRDGAVTITGFDAEHPLFAGLDDPFAPVAEDGYWSALESYVGHHLAGVAVEALADGGPDGARLLLNAVGPGYGWTEDAAPVASTSCWPPARRPTSSAWTRDVEQAAPPAPTLATEDPSPTTAGSATLTGTAEFRSSVSILRDGEVVAGAEPARDGSFSVDVDLVEGPNAFTAVATNRGGDSPPSDEVVVVRDTTGPELEWTPSDGDGVFEEVVTVGGTATDLHAPPVALTVNGEPVAVDEGGGTWSTSVTLAEGANVVRVVAADALGNETVEERTIGHIPYSVEWQLADETGRGAMSVFLAAADAEGAPTQVESATLDVVDADGVVVDTRPISWQEREERYRALVSGLPGGTYTLLGRLEVDGWNVTVVGPEVVRR